jgi:hypothetical protein
MGKLLGFGGSIAQKFGGGWGKAIGTGMQLAGSAIGNSGNRSDSMVGTVAQGLLGLRY